MPKKLSKTSEARLTTALEKASELIESGSDPNDAVVSAVNQYGIPSGHVHLMTSAINIGRTNARRMTENDPFDKSANFPVATASAVLQKLYPDEVQTKEVEKNSTAIDPIYNSAPNWLNEKRRIQLVKSANTGCSMTEGKKPEAYMKNDIAADKAFNKIKKMNKDVEFKRLKVSQVRNKAAKLIDEFKTYLTKFNHIPFDEIRENCELMYGKHASLVLESVKPKKDLNYKKSSTLVDENDTPYKLFREIVKVAAEFSTENSEYKQLLEASSKEAVELLRPFVQYTMPGRRSVIADQLSTKKLAGVGDLISKGFGVITGMDAAKNIAGHIPLYSDGDKKLQEKTLHDLMDPYHELELRNIKSEALLNDLMANDDVIKGHDPEEVVDAFNEVSQLTPYSYNNKAIIRDLVRKRLSGGPQALDQFTAGDAVKTQDTLREMGQHQQGQSSIMRTLGVLPSYGDASAYKQ